MRTLRKWTAQLVMFVMVLVAIVVAPIAAAVIVEWQIIRQWWEMARVVAKAE